MKLTATKPDTKTEVIENSTLPNLKESIDFYLNRGYKVTLQGEGEPEKK